MVEYEKKALGALDKIIDAIYYEEGRLAVINKYGTLLSDEEKTKATQLITKQRANLDRLFEVYKKDLDPLMTDICQVGAEMEPLVSKLFSAEMIAKQMVFQQEVAAMNNAASTVAEPAVATDVESKASNEGIELNFGNVEGSGATTVSAPVSAENGVMTGSETVPLPNAQNEATMITPVENMVNETTTVEATSDVASGVTSATDDAVSETTTETATIEGAGSGGETPSDSATGDSTASSEETSEEVSTGFVLSPIDEGVALPTNDEVKVAEEGVVAADQQLQAVDAMKNEIENNPALSDEEKANELAKYTRMTDGAVKAILVTKAQYEKLLASRDAQKVLLGGNKDEQQVVNDITSAAVATIPNITGSEEQKVEGTGEVTLPSIDTASTTAEENSANTEGFVLPMIEGAGSTTDTSTSQAASDNSQVVLPTIEVPGATPASTTAATDNQNELQTMIEQANTLYKEGKTAEAQALFDKVGAMNKELQAGESAPATGVIEDAMVFVKK